MHAKKTKGRSMTSRIYCDPEFSIVWDPFQGRSLYFTLWCQMTTCSCSPFPCLLLPRLLLSMISIVVFKSWIVCIQTVHYLMAMCESCVDPLFFPPLAILLFFSVRYSFDRSLGIKKIQLIIRVSLPSSLAMHSYFCSISLLFSWSDLPF
jgi:hypothetical protein